MWQDKWLITIRNVLPVTMVFTLVYLKTNIVKNALKFKKTNKSNKSDAKDVVAICILVKSSVLIVLDCVPSVIIKL